MDEKREEKLRKVPLWTSDPISWPDNVRSVASDEMDNLGVDRLGNLFWAGKPVVVKRIALSTGKKSWDILIAMVALLASLSVIAQGTVVTHTWLCDLGHAVVLQCPSQ